ncbi:MAG: zinc ribbon domain-containing protein [Capsulimonadales bacterium]|nr:zinc ribbon domain-containing protein [Capsulimonadales bacterium]
MILLFGVVGWLAWPYIQDLLQQQRTDDRIMEKVMHRRQLVAQAPHSPASHEQLADALREANKLEDAIAEYELALRLEEQYAPAGGWHGGGGIEQKLKLTRMELGERQDPDKHGISLRTRQQPCTQCGHLANPGERMCPTCGAPLPVDSFWDTVRDPAMREMIVREASEFAIILAVIGIALWMTGWLTLEIRLVTFFAAFIVLCFRFLKRVGPD